MLVKNNKKLALIAIKSNNWTLCYLSNELQNDKEIVLASIKENSLTLRYVSNELKKQIGDNDPIIILENLIKIKKEQMDLETKINNENMKNNIKISIKI